MSFISWLTDTLTGSPLHTQRKEMLDFLRYLRGLDDREVGFFIAFATDFRNRVKSRWDLLDPASALESEPGLCAILQRRVWNLQRAQRPVEAARAAIWLHTLRAEALPELRETAQLVWVEIERGMPYARTAATNIAVSISAAGNKRPLPLTQDLSAFPKGFAPQH